MNRQSLAYQRANARLQAFKRSTTFRRAVGELSRLAWKRRKAAKIAPRDLQLVIEQEVRKLI